MAKKARVINELHRDFWSQFCEINYKRSVFYAWHLSGSGDTAEDIVHNAITKILELVPNPDKVKDKVSYLSRSVHNAWVDWLKDKDKLPAASIDDPDNTEVQAIAAPERDANMDSENDAYRLPLRTEMKRLDERERKLLRLYLRGFNCEEIGARLGEDARVISYDLNAVRTKVRYRLKLHVRKPKGPVGHE